MKIRHIYEGVCVLVLSVLSVFGCTFNPGPNPNPCPSPTRTVVPTVTPTIAPTATPTQDLLHKILIEPEITTQATTCTSGGQPAFKKLFDAQRMRVRDNFPEFFYSPDCVKNGTEPITGRSYRDLYSLATAYFVRDVGFYAIMDPNNKAEVAIKSDNSFNEQFQTLEGGLSPYCDKLAIRVLNCSGGCFKATCSPAWFDY